MQACQPVENQAERLPNSRCCEGWQGFLQFNPKSPFNFLLFKTTGYDEKQQTGSGDYPIGSWLLVVQGMRQLR